MSPAYRNAASPGSARLSAVLLGTLATAGSAVRAGRASAALRRQEAVNASRPEHFWQPTDYSRRGCMSVPSVPLEHVMTERMGMTVNKCFGFCSLKRGMDFFAVTGGDTCWCGEIYQGTKADDFKCSSNCSGNKEKGCGGSLGKDGTYADVYIMFDCAENTEEEKKLIAQEKHEEIMSAYSYFPDQTCGQALENQVKAAADGGKIAVASVDECKVMCMHAPPQQACHGFTYNKVLQKCTFHSDVLEGDILKNKDNECYFKTLGSAMLQVLKENATKMSTTKVNATSVTRRCRLMPQ